MNDKSAYRRQPRARTLPAILPRPLKHRLQEGSPLARIGALLVVFLLIHEIVLRTTRLGSASYAEPILALELLAQPLSLGVLAAGLALARFGSLLCAWDALEHGARLRWFVLALAVLVVWPFTAYGYNYYLDQGHYLDRALLLALLALSFWRPVFVIPLIALVYTSMWQIAEPGLGGTVYQHKLQVLKVLELFAAWLVVHALVGAARAQDLVFMCCCAIAGSYWQAGLAKLQLGWLAYGQLHHALLSAYAHGWLGQLAPERIVSLSEQIALLDRPMQLFVLVIEAGCIAFLWRRRLSLGLLICLIVFHAGVLALYGFFFWTWMGLDLALLVLLARDLKARRYAIYDRPHLLLSIPLIGLAGLWFKPPALGWFDTVLSHTYRIEVIGESGRRYSLPPQFLSPYEDVFTMSAFSYLIEGRGRLVGAYGVTKSLATARALAACRTPACIFELEARAEPRADHAVRSQRLYTFLQRYLASWNRLGPRAEWLAMAAPPAQFLSAERAGAYRRQEPVAEIVVSEVTTWFDGERLREIRRLELARLAIPVASASERGPIW